MQKIAIFGAGISGLSLGSILIQKGFPKNNLCLFERKNKTGGLINSIKEKGYLTETAANGFLSNKKEMLDLCNSLNLESELIHANKASSKKYIYFNGQLNLVPSKPQAIFFNSILSFQAKMRIILEFIQKKNLLENQETISEFFTRKFGKEIYQKLVDPFITGIYAGDGEKLSLEACFPKLKEMENTYGSILKGLFKKKGSYSSLISFKEGLQTLIDKMQKLLTGRIFFDKSLKDIKLTKNQVECIFDDGEKAMFDKIVLAIPAYETAKIFSSSEPTLAKFLFQIPYVPIVICVLGFPNHTNQSERDNFGFLVPSSVSKEILGVLYCNSIFKDMRAPQNMSLVRVMLGGARNPQIINQNDEEILKISLKNLKQISQIQPKLDHHQIIRWDKAIPQYEMKHLEILDKLSAFEQEYPVLFHGNSYRGIGIADCVRNSYLLTKRIML